MHPYYIYRHILTHIHITYAGPHSGTPIIYIQTDTCMDTHIYTNTSMHTHIVSLLLHTEVTAEMPFWFSQRYLYNFKHRDEIGRTWLPHLDNTLSSQQAGGIYGHLGGRFSSLSPLIWLILLLTVKECGPHSYPKCLFLVMEIFIIDGKTAA